MMLKNIALTVAMAFGMALAGGQAQASLIGSEATIKYVFGTPPTTLSTDVVTIGAGSEITCPAAFGLCGLNPTFEVDFVADSVTVRVGVTSFTPADFNGFSFEGLNFGPNLILAGVLLDTNFADLTDSLVSFGDDFVSINLSGLVSPANAYFSLNFLTREVAVQTPAPGALILLGLSIAGLGLARRRRL